jgi:sec-independent protein translocase protein TatA
MGIGWQEIVLILLVVLLLFGAKRLPEVGKALGKGIREFKKATKGIEEEEEENQEDHSG